MTAYLVRRFAQATVVLIGVTIIVFVLERLLPGGAARAVLGPRATSYDIAAWNHQNGFDQPVVIQYLDYLRNLAHGDLGISYTFNESVLDLISLRLPKTLLLVGLGTLVAVGIAVPLGSFQATFRNRLPDYVITSVAFVVYSMPAFWIGILLILWLSASLNIFPPEAPQADSVLSYGPSDWLALVLPVMTMAITQIALFSRYTRSAVLDNLVQDYVRTAYAKGASQAGVLFRHVLRNAVIPIITLLGLQLPAIASGALVTESVFNYPGMGLLFVQSAFKRDYPVLLGATVVVALATVVGSLLADILYAVADPRVRYTT